MADLWDKLVAGKGLFILDESSRYVPYDWLECIVETVGSLLELECTVETVGSLLELECTVETVGSLLECDTSERLSGVLEALEEGLERVRDIVTSKCEKTVTTVTFGFLALNDRTH